MMRPTFFTSCLLAITTAAASAAYALPSAPGVSGSLSTATPQYIQTALGVSAPKRTTTIAAGLVNYHPELESAARSKTWADVTKQVSTATIPQVSYDRVMTHLHAFQDIADRHDGDRSHGRPGYRESVDYVKKFLDDAGFDVTIQEFTAKGATGYNLIADLPGGDEERTVIVGAHLDGVPNVAAISDNGTGSAAILEVALEAAKAKKHGVSPKNHLRFIWFGAEELVMVGSSYYVKQLSWPERLDVLGYLNYDMIASPNPGYFVLDGDDSDDVGFPAGPPGSAYLEKVHEEYYESVQVPTRGWDVNGIMDYGPFMDAGIAVGGMATGASSRMSEEQATLWGGKANHPFDACYHRPCDDINNINHDALKTNSQAIAHVVWRVSGMQSAQ